MDAEEWWQDVIKAYLIQGIGFHNYGQTWYVIQWYLKTNQDIYSFSIGMSARKWSHPWWCSCIVRHWQTCLFVHLLYLIKHFVQTFFVKAFLFQKCSLYPFFQMTRNIILSRQSREHHTFSDKNPITNNQWSQSLIHSCVLFPGLLALNCTMTQF